MDKNYIACGRSEYVNDIVRLFKYKNNDGRVSMISLENVTRLEGLGIVSNKFGPPDLSQLLEEVESRGYEMSLLGSRHGYQFGLAADEGIFSDWWPENNEYADTPEDAVALALIEIVKGEK